MRSGTSIRRAIIASVGLHILLAVGLVSLARWQAAHPTLPGTSPRIDTRVDIRFESPSAEPETSVEVSVATPAPTPITPPPEPPTESPPAAEPKTTDTTPLPAPDETRPPLGKTTPVPQTLPPEMLALLKKPQPATVVEVPLTLTPLDPESAATPPSQVRPAGGLGERPPAPSRPTPTPGSTLEGGVPLHSALAPGQTIVYVLDKSGSMGAGGKYEVALRALVATLKAQPPTVRFQVVVYEGYAFPPLPATTPTGLISATAVNVDRMADALRILSPRGRSNHIEGLREALTLGSEQGPDFVILLTDGNDLPISTIRSLRRGMGKRSVVYVAPVTDEGVGKLIEMK